MTDWREPKLPKWPFYGGDLLLLTVAAWIVHQSPHPLGPWPLLCLVACTMVGAWVCVTPFLVEYRASIRFAESDSLNSGAGTVGQNHRGRKGNC
jgi:hypothetical protein